MAILRISHRAILALLLACAADTALAQWPECGVYRDEVTGLHIEVLNADQAVEYQLNPEGQPINRTPLLLGGQDGHTYAMPAEHGGTPEGTRFKLSEDGERIQRDHGPGRDFVRTRSTPCQARTLPPPGQCRRHLGDCMSMLWDPQRPASWFKATCDEGVAHACRRWVEVSQLDAAGVGRDQRQWPPTTEAERDALVDPPSLDAGILDQLPAICERHRSMDTCKTMGDALWRGLRPRQALAAWRAGCRNPNRLDLTYSRCGAYRALEAAFDEQPRAVEATTLPCGLYRGGSWDLDFHADGSATFNGGETHPAVLEQGDIVFHLAPDIALRLRPLASGQLIGLNSILLQDVLVPANAAPCRPAP